MYIIRGTDEVVKTKYSGAVIGFIAVAGVFVLYKYLDRKLMKESGKSPLDVLSKKYGRKS